MADMASQLPPDVSEKIDALAEKGNALMENGAYESAASVFREGLDALPQPLEQWSATLWFLTSIGDAQWFLGEHHQALTTWQNAIRFGGFGNPFVHLRRGQVLFELDRREESADELLRALLIAGEEIFEPEHDIYWDFITSVAKPPHGASTWNGFTGVEEGSPASEWLMDPGQYSLFASE